MGKRHREARKRVKAEVVQLLGVRTYQSELGELKVRMTKAEARRRIFVRHRMRAARVLPSVEELLGEFREQARSDVLAAMSEGVAREIDLQVLG